MQKLEKKFLISTTELLGVFHESLVRLVPVVEKIKMPWADNEAYDDWDSIAECLYENIVIRSIKNSEEIQGIINFPKYNFIMPSYDNLAFLEIKNDNISSDCIAVFVGFSTKSAVFSDVAWINLSENNKSHKLQYASYDNCSFSLRLPKAMPKETLEKFNVLL